VLLRRLRLIALFPDWQEEVFPFIAIFPLDNTHPLKTKTFLNFVVNEGKKNTVVKTLADADHHME
jgi:hypothetical protein